MKDRNPRTNLQLMIESTRARTNQHSLKKRKSCTCMQENYENAKPSERNSSKLKPPPNEVSGRKDHCFVIDKEIRDTGRLSESHQKETTSRDNSVRNRLVHLTLSCGKKRIFTHTWERLWGFMRRQTTRRCCLTYSELKTLLLTRFPHPCKH